jgi:ABC-type cobalamin/Fe3+-siderophores transport system ATPase subunit
MAYIVEFSIAGLAGRKKEITRTLNRDLNIFFGVNGAGKTTLLRILNAAMSNDSDSLSNVPFESARVVIHSDQYKKNYAYEIVRQKPKRMGILASQELVRETMTWTNTNTIFPIGSATTVSTRRTSDWRITPDLPKDSAGRWSHRFLTTTRMFEGIESGKGTNQLGEEFFDIHFESLLQRHWAKYFGGIQANVRAIQEQGFAVILQQILGAKKTPSEANITLDWKQAYDNVASFLRRQHMGGASILSEDEFKGRFQSDDMLRAIVSIVDRVERDIEVAMEPRSKLGGIIEKMFSGPKKVRFGATEIDVTSDDNESIGLRSLSSGEKQILRLLLEVGQADTSTLMIDEPELSMHIDWQRELVDAMNQINPRAQLVLATHSPEIMAQIEDSKIFAI